MKNRWLSLLLCVVLVLPVVLAGCQNQQTEEDILDDAADAARDTMTLTMWLVAEEKPSKETVNLIEDAVNKILKSKYKTRVELSYFTEDEYYDALDKKLVAVDEAYYAEEDIEDDITNEPPKTVIGEMGIIEDWYPEVEDSQLDIIYLSGFENYIKYSDGDPNATDETPAVLADGALERLDDHLKASAKKLNSYIDPSFFSALSANGGIYGIPNRHIIGEYVYLLVNRQLADEYYYDPESFTSLAACATFIEDVAANNKDYTPIKQIGEPLYTTYWSIDDNRSIIGSVGNASTAESTYLSMRNILTYSRYVDQLKTEMAYREKGYIAEDPDSVDKFAVAIVRGGAELEKEYGEDYYMTVLEAPIASEEEMFEAMFSITTYTKSAERSMEVLTLLNTDPALKNLLQYGIEGTHYVLDEEDKSLKRLNNDYMMDNVKTGNTFIAYPEEGQPLDIWEYGKKQNLDVVVSPFNGFSFHDSDLDMELMGRLAELSKEYFERLDACKTVAELEEFLDAAKTELATNEDVKKAISTTESGSPNQIYTDWYYVKYPPIDEE